MGKETLIWSNRPAMPMAEFADRDGVEFSARPSAYSGWPITEWVATRDGEVIGQFASATEAKAACESYVSQPLTPAQVERMARAERRESFELESARLSRPDFPSEKDYAAFCQSARDRRAAADAR